MYVHHLCLFKYNKLKYYCFFILRRNLVKQVSGRVRCPCALPVCFPIQTPARPKNGTPSTLASPRGSSDSDSDTGRASQLPALGREIHGHSHIMFYSLHLAVSIYGSNHEQR